MTKLKITFVLPYAGLAGGIRVIAIYASGLRTRGHDVKIVSVPKKPLPVKQKIKHLLKEKKWPATETNISHLDNIAVDHHIIEKYRPITNSDVPDADFVIATWWETATWVHSLSANKGQKVYFMQDYGAPGQELEKIIPTWLLPLHKITIAQWLADLIHAEVGDVPVDVVPNAVDHNLFFAPARSKQRVPTVGFVYRRSRSKGADIVFQAFEHVVQLQENLRLIAFGSEPAPDFQSPKFTYFRTPAENELSKLYSSCDMWIFPSRLEGFGLPILEAMACRTPVIATPAGAAPELLQGGGGILLKDYTVEEMIRAMESISVMTEIDWQRMSQKAYESVASYTWEEATVLFEQVLLNLYQNKDMKNPR